MKWGTLVYALPALNALMSVAGLDELHILGFLFLTLASSPASSLCWDTAFFVADFFLGG